MSSFDVSEEYAWLLNGLANVSDDDAFFILGLRDKEEKIIGHATERLRRETLLLRQLDQEFKNTPKTDPMRSVLNERKVIVDRLRKISLEEISIALNVPIGMDHIRAGGVIVDRSIKLRLADFCGK